MSSPADDTPADHPRNAQNEAAADLAGNIAAPRAPLVQRKARLSLIWLVPVVAAVIGLSMLVHAWLSEGPEITITFQSAAGLEAGKTPVKYKDVVVGNVKTIKLSADSTRVIVTVALAKSAETLARTDTRFWVVRPRIGAGGVSGIDTLLSGAYIGVDKGTATTAATAFGGLETPPTVINGMPGKTFLIRADDLGSLDIGSPVYFRRIQVGRVASYKLDADGHGVSLRVFIDAPYDRFVGASTRFWNASGVDVSLGADGLKLKTQSMAVIVAGGIAFSSTAVGSEAPAAADTTFTLASDQEAAMAPPDGPAQHIMLRFNQPVRGLRVGAPVEFSGFNLGRVVSVEMDYDPATHHFPAIVNIDVYPSRMGRVLNSHAITTLPAPESSADEQQRAPHFLATMVAHGLRAQVRSANLLTGQLYIALDFVPNAPKVAFDINARPLVLPTVSGSFDKLQEQLASIVAKVDRMPLESIARNLDGSLGELKTTLQQVNGQLLPEGQRTMQQARQSFSDASRVLAEDSPLQQNLGQTLSELQRTARSMRTLTDLLERHPEVLLRGRPASMPPAPAPAPGAHPEPASLEPK